MHSVTFIPGDGIGPEVINAAVKVIDAAGVNIKWERMDAGQHVMKEFGTPLPPHVIDSIRRNKAALKGPITTPVATGFRSINVSLRKELNLFASVRPCKTFEGVPSRYKNINLIIVRENTEDLYAGIEHMIGDFAAESIKIITRKASEMISRHAFELARTHNRKKVTSVHKANIMKCTDGLFLEAARSIASEYPEIQYEEMIVDAMCMNLVQIPEQYDVLVMPNLYGDILSDLCAGLIGGLGIAPGGNLGDDAAVFEPVHGSAPKLAGKNAANPTAAILSGVMMLRHLGENHAADIIEDAVKAVLKENKYVTPDFGGSTGTQEFADKLVDLIRCH